MMKKLQLWVHTYLPRLVHTGLDGATVRTTYRQVGHGVSEMMALRRCHVCGAEWWEATGLRHIL